MGNLWTEEQKQVIWLRNRNILVSAAAGSGKTAVLVERILQKITDREHPVDIDRLLIVTFTRAAAAEMRERIGLEIQKRLLADPDNENLQRQETLLFHAQITTIDSFCQSVLRTYFHLIDLDPAFSIVDEGEAKLLRRDTAEELLEEKYREGDTDFLQFVECFANGKNDENLIEMIWQVYEFSRSHPWPEEWLEECKKNYDIDTLEDLISSEWMKMICEQVDQTLNDLEMIRKEALKVANSPYGPWMYADALEQDGEILKQLSKGNDYAEYARRFLNIRKFAVLSRKKDEEVSDEKREQVKLLRDQIKKGIASLQEQYFYQSPQEMLEELKAGKVSAQMLLMLASEFGMRFTEKKRERNLLDFSDLEHLALQILVKKENGNVVPGEAALAFSKQFEEIMIDEYQDSNMVQELILTSISRCSMGQNNLFMVGDVKQSIYRFRLACPELFMEKYDTYTTEDSENQKIELHKNFRSRKEVLFDVNFIFRKIMHRNLGNVEYDDNAALYAGIEFPELVTNVEMDDLTAAKSPLSGSEILLFDADSVTETNAREAEARMIGGQIKAIVGRELVYDKESRHYRKAEYRDIVILLRSLSGWSEEFLAVLSDMGIPAYTGTRSGYFSALEVRTVLSFLRVLDNPRQDIPFTAVLTSPIGTFATEELAKIRTENPEVSYYEACRAYENAGSDGILREKLQKFFKVLEHFRSCVPYTPMHELLWKIYEETGYFDYVCAMPAGSQRKANLEMLAEKAAAYESTSYRGLFNFVRYIENLQKYEVDFGEASTIGEEENTVRIMSIHKSKGLEFPVVFVAGLGKAFNRQDARSTIAIHQNYGVGCDVVDPLLRTKAPTILKKAIQQILLTESLGEELRVLYVAVTRAKEKLYLSGSLKKMEDTIAKWSGGAGKKQLSYLEIKNAASMLEWILRSVLYEEGIQSEIPIRKYSVDDLYREKLDEENHGDTILRQFRDHLFEKEEGYAAFLAWMTQESAKIYPYEGRLEIQGKCSVSEIKRQSQIREQKEEPENQGIVLIKEPEDTATVPKFLEAKEEKSGAVKGTAMHHVMQRLDFTAADTVRQVEAQLLELQKKKQISEEEISLLNIPAIVHFFQTDIGKRAADAARRGQLYREKQFVIGVPASDIRPQWDKEEMVLVQGIIDAWFYEGEQIVLLDYKTDRVLKGQEQKLKERYQAQLDYYAKALKQTTGHEVKEKIIYAFSLQEGIAL